MNDILEELEAEEVHRGPKGCVEKAIADHPEYEADILRSVQSPYPASSVSRALRRRGILLSDYTVLRHRQYKCRCPEEYRG